jgi:hypothetical protein
MFNSSCNCTLYYSHYSRKYSPQISLRESLEGWATVPEEGTLMAVAVEVSNGDGCKSIHEPFYFIMRYSFIFAYYLELLPCFTFILEIFHKVRMTLVFNYAEHEPRFVYF